MENNKLKWGYYDVGGTVHLNKVSALIDGTNRNIYPQWKFNNHTFDQFNWSIEPSESVTDLYLERACELREKYDYIILMYSAGSDSQTVFDTFVKNNIKIDEIVVSWASGLSNAYTPDSSNFSHTNVLSEWDFTIKPRLEDISKKYPEIKITVNDWVSGFRNFKVHEDYVVDRNVNYSPYGPLRWGFEHIPSISDAIIKKQNVCILWGSDKPRICINNGHYQLYFLDLVANSFTADITHSVYSEMFYWNESCARLVAKQAHLLVNFFESNPRFKQYIQWPISNPANRQFYENVVRAIIYPELDLNFFQTNKMPSWNIAADIVLFRIGDDIENKINRYHSENFKYLRTVIDKKFFQNNGESLTGFISGMYNIRKA